MILWQASEQRIKASNIFKFQQYVETQKKLTFNDYAEFWQWSVNNIEDFWSTAAIYFNIKFHSPPHSILERPTSGMMGANWFNGATLNYAEHIFLQKTDARPALIYKNENLPSLEISWQQLEKSVKNLQNYFIKIGLKKGDRVAAYMPNTPEAIYAFLAANSLGLIWSCCSPDFGTESIIDRFVQIEPKLFVASGSYIYNGRAFDKSEVIQNISDAIPSLTKTLLVESDEWKNIIEEESDHALTFTPVAFSHPIWILYSSGTTGKPKAITHGTGGVLIELYKALHLHQDCQTGERFFWYSTTGWMMWNYALSSLLVGCTLCIYDGSPSFPSNDALWDFASELKLNHFGVGASFYLNYMKHTHHKISQGLSSLKFMGTTGSPLSNDGFKWIYSHVKSDVHLGSISGGTDVCSAFVTANPCLPVRVGEIQCRALGCRIEAFNDDNQAVLNEVGELYITQPMPSMPVFFWNDPENEKYKASYYENNPKYWCHGDWIKITESGGVIIYGRSDATLNRDGVRIGTAEIYSAIEPIEEIADSLVLSIEQKDGSYWMPLFVQMAKGQTLNETLKQKINANLKQKYSPRHIPDEIIEIPDVPYTISGKKMEMPAKKILMGVPLAKAISLDAMRNPASVDWFINKAKEI